MKKGNLYSGVFPQDARTVPQLRTAAKSWLAQNRGISVKEFAALVTSFMQEPSTLKKCMGGILLGYLPTAQRSLLDPFLYEKWLNHMTGWAEVDAICYNNFTSEEMLSDFPVWRRLIKGLSVSENIHKRRGAIVLLTKPVGQSDDKRLRNLAFEVIGRLQQEKHILITKAVSWLLRSLIKWHRAEVEAYLHDNQNTLPKIAIRETTSKLRSGTKSGRSAKRSS
jgi:3-methyladenine DNA glycosylase AlkD